MLNWALLKKREKRNFIKIISNNYCIYIKKVYLKDFLVLTKINVKNRVDKNKH